MGHPAFSLAGRDTSFVFLPKETGPDVAKQKFEEYAKGLKIPEGMELGEVSLDEEKSANNLYYGTIVIKKPDGAKIKRKIADDLLEMFGEKLVEGVSLPRMTYSAWRDLGR